VTPVDIAAPSLHLCGGCLKLDRCRLGITAERLDADGVAHYNLACPTEHEGGPGTAHGGWTAAALEEVLGRVVYLQGQMSVAKSLAVDFLKPLPIGMPLLGRSWVTKRDDRRWSLAGELTLASTGLTLARATGESVLVDVDAHYRRFDAWKRTQ
jgi:acyl-coenzyme A thioesterase PaaI-like protein